MATFVNDLRLTELATGEGSGTWGTTTNTNLSLIGEAFSFGTEAITTNADTHTTTIADGSTDPGRSLFLKYTGTLDSACTITIAPNTVSKLWFIENATSGSQNIIIKQGSGATITIPNGQTKAIYSDGAGSGGAMVDAFQDLSIPDLFVDDDLTIGDDLTFTSDSAVITFGADGDTTLTHTDGSGLTLNSTNKIMFNDASQFIQGSSATVLSLGATDEIDLTATAIDVNGTIDVSGNATLGGTLGVTGAVTANAGVSIDNFTIDGAEIDCSADMTIDVTGDLTLDVSGGDVRIKADGTQEMQFKITDGANVDIISTVSDDDIRLRGNDGGSTITALTLDMSDAGKAIFNAGASFSHDVTIDADDRALRIGAGQDLALFHDATDSTMRSSTGDFIMSNTAQDKDILFKGNDASSTITALQLDMSQAGRATFNEGIVLKSSSAGDFGVNINTASGDSMKLQVTDTGTGGAANGTISVSDGDLTLDVSGDIILDADGGDFNFKDGGTTLLSLSNAGSNNVQLSTSISDGDLLIKGNDGGSIITALTFDMSAAGRAIFGADADMADGQAFRFGDSQDLLIFHSSDENIIQANTTDQDLIFKGVDGGSSITALTLDMSAAGAATFNAGATLGGALSGTTASFATSSTSDSVFTLTDTGVAAYEVIFPDTGTYQLQTNTSSDKTFKLFNQGTGTFLLDVEGSVSGTSLIATEGLLELDDNGTHNGIINVPASCRINIDSDNNSTGESFQVGVNATNISSSNILFKIDESGNTTVGDPTYGSSLGQLRVINDANATAPASLSLFGFGNVADDGEFAKLEFAMQISGTGGNVVAKINGVAEGTSENAAHLTFQTATSGTLAEKMRLDSNGVLMVNATSQIGSGGGTTAGLVVRGGGGGPHVAVLRNLDTSGGANQIEFQDGNGDVCGAINSNATNNTTSYGTSSDYRLKENVSAVSGAIDKLKRLEPKTYNFISNTEKTKEDGFLAHELAEVVPNAVTGEKDAVHDNGEMDIQQVDYGKLTPLLTAALQEAIAKIETLEAEVAALKGE